MNVDYEQNPKIIGHDMTCSVSDFFTGVTAKNILFLLNLLRKTVLNF